MQRKLLPAMFGSLVEFYDFSIYSFSAIILAPLFFPESHPVIAIIQSYGIFAAGNLARPLGAFLFGIMGDKYGRKKTLEFTIIGIAIPTFIISVTPTFDSIGYLAPIILLCCRIIQGIFVGGEADGVAIYIQESTKPSQACFANSLNRTTSSAGIFLGSLIVFLCNMEGMNEWGWRIPFVLGGLLGLVTLWLRKGLIETDEFVRSKKREEKTKLKETKSYRSVLKDEWTKILIVIIMCGAHGGIYNFFYVFWFNYLGDVTQMVDRNTTELWKSIALFIYVVFSPLTGALADRLGLEKILKYSIYLGFPMIGVSGMLLHFSRLNTGWFVLFSVWVTLFLAPSYVLVMRLFDPSVRYRCLSLGHAIGSALFSGTAPAVGVYMWHLSGGILYAPLLYLLSLVLLMGIGLFFMVRITNLRKNDKLINSNMVIEIN